MRDRLDDQLGDRSPTETPEGAGTPERTDVPEAPSYTASPGASTHAPAEREFTVEERSQLQLVLRRFLQHRAAVASLVIFIAVVLFAYAGPLFWGYSIRDITPDESMPPSWKHPFGTTGRGRDLLALVMAGTQLSLQISFIVAALSGVFGTAWGAISGFYRGWADAFMMRVVDLVLTFPLIAIAAVIGAQFRGTWWAIALVIAALLWTQPARIVRGVTLSLREKEFVEAARALGASDRRIIFRHVVPNALGPIIVNITIMLAVTILIATALSYLGFGVTAPNVSLGLLVNQAQSAVSTRPWLFYIPGLFIIIIALTVNFIGDGLRDAFDPQQAKVRK